VFEDSRSFIISGMSSSGEPRLSLSEWVVLCLICEGPTHGFAVSASLARDSDLGQIWHVPKAVVYRAIDRLEPGLIRATGQEPSSRGPVRSLAEATRTGRSAARVWLAAPTAHPRDVRSELLIKLALLIRSGADTTSLLRDQRAQLLPIAGAMEGRLRETTGSDHILALWRRESISATLRFLEAASGR
jgi:DNA-binding PadR family transcriptional regulator